MKVIFFFMLLKILKIKLYSKILMLSSKKIFFESVASFSISFVKRHPGVFHAISLYWVLQLSVAVSTSPFPKPNQNV